MIIQRRPVAQYDVALIPCTRGKRPEGMTARTLYKGGIFSLNVRHAALSSKRTLVLSAKYGLLGLDDPVRYYDAYIPALGPRERAQLLALIAEQAKPLRDLRILSYLPAAYYAAFAEAAPWATFHCDRPFKGIPSLTLSARLSREIKSWPSS